MVLGAAYSLWRYNRVAYGNLKRRYRGVGTEEMKDLDRQIWKGEKEGEKKQRKKQDEEDGEEGLEQWQ